MIKCGELLQPLMPLLKELIINHTYIQADETTLQVLNEPGRDNTNKSYMWVFKGGPPHKPGVIFEYQPSRAGIVADLFLKDFTGALQIDGYKGYLRFKSYKHIELYLCWAHSRRKIWECSINRVNN